MFDVALKRVCARHDIPTPGLGYWAKVAHGKLVSRIALPPCTSPQRDTSHAQRGLINDLQPGSGG